MLQTLRRYIPLYVGIIFCTIALINLVSAGSLTPSASPTSTSYTLTDIYNRLVTGATTTSSTGNFAPGAAPTRTLHSLEDIYNAIPTLDPTQINTGTVYMGVTGTLDGDFPTSTSVCSTDTTNGVTGTLTIAAANVVTGTTYCGVAGTAVAGGADLSNMFNGTGIAAGGSQANGGTTQDGVGGSDNYRATWTDCNAGNSYCGTGLASAEARDENTGLIWSYPCAGTGCTSFDAGTAGNAYTWDNTGASNNSQTASQMCSAGGHGETGWSLPHQLQLMQAYINNGTDHFTVNDTYWTATHPSWTTNRAYTVNIAAGDTGQNPINTVVEGWGGTGYVICIR